MRCSLSRACSTRSRAPLYTRRPPADERAATATKPGDRYNAETSWEELLPAYGWRRRSSRRGTRLLDPARQRRGTSATTNYQGNDLLWVFTSSTELDPDRSYDRFGFYAVMEHGGNFRAAAGALR